MKCYQISMGLVLVWLLATPLSAQNYYAVTQESYLDVLTPKGASGAEPIMVERSRSMEEIILAGNAAFETGDLETARARYSEALAIHETAETFVVRGLINYEQGLAQEALTDFDAAIRLKPDYPEAYFHKGDVLMDLTFFKSAISAYDMALSFEPNDVIGLNNRGLAKLFNGKPEEAWEDLYRAYELASSLDMINEVLINMSRCKIALKDYAMAYKCAKGAMEANDNHAGSFHALADAEAALGHHAAAYRSYVVAYQLDPHLPELLEGCVRSQLAMGNVEKAFQELTRLERQHPHYAAIDALWLAVEGERRQRTK